MRKLDFKVCRICGKPVTPRLRNDRRAYWYPRQCADCRKKARNEPLRRFRISLAIQGMNHPMAKDIGSRRLTNHGNYQYWLIKTGPLKTDWQYEHRIILAQKLERPLLANEVAHHINGNTLDNRGENLELMERATHVAFHHF